MASRREFLAHSLTAAALAALPGSVFAADRAARPLKLLVLGGTGFLGPHFVERAHAH